MADEEAEDDGGDMDEEVAPGAKSACQGFSVTWSLADRGESLPERKVRFADDPGVTDDKRTFLGSYPLVNNQLRAASLRTRRLVPIELAACCLYPDDVERLESSHVEQIRRSSRLGRGCCVGGV
jgi:hypothetical protein